MKMLRQYWRWLLAAIAFSIAFAGGIYICDLTKYADSKYCFALDVTAIFLYAVGTVIEEHHGAFTALATVAIAWFTWTLRRSTDKLWEAGERQLEEIKSSNQLTREIFLVTERPWLYVEKVECAEPLRVEKYGDQNVVTLSLNFYIKNAGRAPATRVWVNAALVIASAAAFDAAAQIEITKDSGRSHSRGFPSLAIFPQETKQSGLALSVFFTDSDVYRPKDYQPCIDARIFGSIVYESGLNNELHETGFSYGMQTPGTISPEPGTQVAAASIRLVEFPIGSYAT